jgi:hypothetical protein
MYYAKVTETKPDSFGKLRILNDIIYGFDSYKWRDTFVREFNELTRVEPYKSSDVSSRASVVKRDVLRYGYQEVDTQHLGDVEYMPLNAKKVWAHHSIIENYEGGWAARVAPLVRVPSRVNYEFSGGYLRPRY